jgi:hypothetical protein
MCTDVNQPVAHDYCGCELRDGVARANNYYTGGWAVETW